MRLVLDVVWIQDPYNFYPGEAAILFLFGNIILSFIPFLLIFIGQF